MVKKIFKARLIESIFKNILFQKLVLGLFFFIMLTAMIFVSALPQKYDLKV